MVVMKKLVLIPLLLSWQLPSDPNVGTTIYEQIGTTLVPLVSVSGVAAVNVPSSPGIHVYFAQSFALSDPAISSDLSDPLIVTNRAMWP